MAHLNGGEQTAGAIDEWSRHSITKISELHFFDEFIEKVIQLGENPKVFIAPSLSADNVKKTSILKKILEKKLGKKLLNKNILITYHPKL